MLLEYLENLAIASLDGKGIAYQITALFVWRYIIWIFLAHFLITIAIQRKKFSAKKYFPRFFFAIYLVILLSFTILPIDFPGINGTTVNMNFSLIPILFVFVNRAQLINLAGNAILFAPVSILGSLAKIKIFEKWTGALLFSLLMSLAIEGIQYFEMVHGYTGVAAVDIIDVITNAAGGLIGWLLVQLYRKNHIVPAQNENKL